MVTYISVRVYPEANKERVEARAKGGYTIYVHEKAERGLATDRARLLLARELGVSEESLRCVKGSRSSAKIFSLYS